MCTFDASKAFNKVHLLALFNKLYKKHLCPLTLHLLMNSYYSQKMRIRWNGTYSDTFTFYLFMQHLYSALFSSKRALMRYIIMNLDKCN